MAELRSDFATLWKSLFLLIALVVAPVQVFAQSAAGGQYYSAIAASDGTVWTWAYNGYGQLGDSTTTSRPLPVNVSGLSGITAVSAGNNHTLALKSDGTVWAWGDNSGGQLGDGTNNRQTSPVQVKQSVTPSVVYLTNVVAIAAGALHSVAIKSDGTVWVWGANSNGQLGDNNYPTARNLPYQLSLSGIVAIAAGASHTLAAASDGTVYAWGSNSNGQIGNSSTGGNQTTPLHLTATLVSSGVIAVAAGAAHSLALKSDGSVVAWGANTYGQIGDGTSANNKATPVSVTQIPGATSIAAGGNHSMLIAQDQSVWAWGYGQYGQLGNNGTSNQPTAVPVTTTPPPVITPLTNIAKIAGGPNHSLAIATDGTVWAWGFNQDRELGEGTLVNRLLPVKVSEASYAWKVGTPTFSPQGGTFNSVWNVTLSTVTSGATIHYTTNGVDPTEADPTVVSGSSVSVSQTLTLKAKAWKTGLQPSNVDGYTYTLVIPVVSLSPGGGTYNVNQNVTVSTSVSGATIHYTTNGVDPTESDPTIASGSTFPVTQTVTLKAKAWKTAWTPSTVASSTYTMKVGTAAFSPGPGLYTSAQTVTVTDVTTTATLHYTTNGLDPTTNDPVIVSGSTVVMGTAGTLRVKGWQTGWTTSDTKIARYIFNMGTVAAPVMTPGGGTYTTAQTVSLSTSTGGALIRYTLDGTDPTFKSPIYAGPLAVSAPTTIKARAFKSDWTFSGPASAAYAFSYGTVDIPTFSPPGGSYTTTQTVTIATTTVGATIHYTTTGLDPTESDPTIASGGTLVVSKSQRLKAQAFLSGTPPSVVRIADYTLTGAVAAGNNFTLALKTDGTVWAWGYNVSGQLGNNSFTNQSSPVQVFQSQAPNPPVPLTNVVAIAAGGAHSLAIKQDGTVYAWGWNGNGQLGNNSTTNSSLAVQAGTLTNVVAIAAGYAHTLAVKSDGTLWVWGSNSSGQLGDGSTTQHTSPFQVTMLTGVSAVAAGFNHSVVLKTDGATSGTVWTAGDNSNGELGDNTATFETTPVSVLSDVVSVGAGDYYSFAVMSDATAMGWGTDSWGQLGDGSGASAVYFPTVVSSPLPFTQMDGGTHHSVGVSADGSAWAWGDGTKIGSSAYTASSDLMTPQRVAGTGTNVFMAFAGTAHSVVASFDGSVWSWGDNSFGQWGIGNTTSTGYVPIQVPNFSLGDQSWLMGDPDHDGLPTWRELQLGTDPMNPDTNGDGVRDGAAVASGISPTSLDTDGDGVPNSVEIMNGTDPLRADTDGDGVDDLHDCFPLDPTRWACPVVDPNDHTPPVITLQYPTNAIPLP